MLCLPHLVCKARTGIVLQAGTDTYHSAFPTDLLSKPLRAWWSFMHCLNQIRLDADILYTQLNSENRFCMTKTLQNLNFICGLHMPT